MRYLSPLRYPGGKARLAPFLARVKWAQGSSVTTYAEPFAGGAGAGLRLLADGHVERLLINDLNPGIAAFWRAVTRDSEAFCTRIENTPVTLEEWEQQRAVYLAEQGSDIDLGFATFFLNRTNRSGILSGRPIGGMTQAGEWKIDARYNKAPLCERVRAVGRLADRISVSQLDALEFLGGLEKPKTTLVYVDPPYIQQGDRLYYNKFIDEKHVELAKALAAADYPWILTYDANDRITDDLYQGERCAEFGISHSAQVRHEGKEYIVFSRDLVVPDMQVLRIAEAVAI